MLSFMLSLRDPSPRQTSASCLQKIRVVQMGRDHLDQPSPELGTFFHVYQLKLEKSRFPLSTLPPSMCCITGKRNQPWEFQMSLLGAAWFLNIWYTQQVGSASWYVPKICNKKWLFSFYKERLVTLKPSIVLLLACVHSLKHCEMGLEQHVYQCFSNHPTVCQFFF